MGVQHEFQNQAIEPRLIILNLTFDSKVIPGIQISSCHLKTSGKHYIDYEYPPSKK